MGVGDVNLMRNRRVSLTLTTVLNANDSVSKIWVSPIRYKLAVHVNLSARG